MRQERCEGQHEDEDEDVNVVELCSYCRVCRAVDMQERKRGRTCIAYAHLQSLLCVERVWEVQRCVV